MRFAGNGHPTHRIIPISDTIVRRSDLFNRNTEKALIRFMTFLLEIHVFASDAVFFYTPRAWIEFLDLNERNKWILKVALPLI